MAEKSFTNRSVTYDVGAWYQGYPFNAQYPINYNMGCVPVTFGGLMNFHKHPSSGEGFLEATNEKPSVNLCDEHYDWELMLPGVVSNPPDDKVEMTSKLMMHLARAMGAKPGSGGVASTHKNATRAVIEHFKYDKNIVGVSIYDTKLGYTPREIEKMSIEELNSGYPFGVEINGHSIVCTGYDLDRENNFQVYMGFGNYDYSWTKFTKEGLYPLTLTLGMRPAEEEILYTSSLTTDFNGMHCGDSGQLSLTLQKYDYECQRFNLRAVLYDESNVRRNIISDDIEINFGFGGEVECIIPLTLPNDITFGDRKLVVEYKYSNSLYRPLRDESDKIIVKNIFTRRTVNEKIKVKNEITFPESVLKGEHHTLYLEIDTQISNSGWLAAVLLDSQNNQIYILGKEFLNPEQSNLKSILCNFEGVSSETNYSLSVVYSETDHFEDSAPSFISSDVGVLTQPIFVKNEEVQYLDNIELMSINNLDLSNPLYGSCIYTIDIDIHIKKQIPHTYLRIIFMDENNNIIEWRQNEIFYGVGDLNVPLTFETPSYQPHNLPKNIKIAFGVVESFDENEKPVFLFFSPVNGKTENPVNVFLMYQNFYDHIFINSSIEISHINSNLQPGDKFELNTSLLFSPDNSSIGIFITDIDVILMGQDGLITCIGKNTASAFKKNVTTSTSVQCEIPPNLSSGIYTLYLKAHNSINEYAEPNDYILPFEHDVEHKLTIEILSELGHL